MTLKNNSKTEKKSAYSLLANIVYIHINPPKMLHYWEQQGPFEKRWICEKMKRTPP